MILGSRRSVLSRGDDRVLIYSALFLICAFISALGAGAVGAVSFLAAAVAIEFAAHHGKSHSRHSKKQIRA